MQQPEEEEGEQLPNPMEVADPEEDEAEQPAPGFNMAEAEFIVAQSAEMAEQHAILESIQNEPYVEANRRFIRQERVATDALFDEVEAEMDEEANAEEPELRLRPYT